MGLTDGQPPLVVSVSVSGMVPACLGSDDSSRQGDVKADILAHRMDGGLNILLALAVTYGSSGGARVPPLTIFSTTSDRTLSE